MALAPADFYAYSQATGTAYPESPEEKAQLAQEVQEFRRNQLKAPQQESNLPGILGAAAAGLGILGAGALAARKLGRGRSQVAPSKQPPVSAASIPNVQEASSAGRVRKAEEITRQARAERPQGVVQTDLNQRSPVKLLPAARATQPSFLETQATSPSYVQEFLSNRIAEQMAGDLIDEVNAFTNPAARSELAKQQASIQGQERKDLWRLVGEIQNETLVDKQQVMRPAAIDQTANALGSSEDQMTGRVKNALQRNEDVDMSRVEWAEDLIESERQAAMGPAPQSQVVAPEADIAINTVASKLPDGLPVDQAEQTPKAKAQAFLQQEFERLGETIPGRYRRERVMGTNPDIAEAMELYAATGDPAVLSRLSETPSSPLTIRPKDQTAFIDPEISTGKLYQPVQKETYVGDLVEKDIDLTNKISALGMQKQAIGTRLQEIDELEPQLRFAMASDPEKGGYYTQMFGKLMNEKQNLPDPSSFNVDLGDALAERDFTRVQLESAQNLGPEYKLSNVQEGYRPFYEQTPEGDIIPETLEIRMGRPSRAEGIVEQAASGGGIRGRVAQYDPASQTGSSIGAYGIEPRNYPIADPTLRPTVLQRVETKVPLRRTPGGTAAPDVQKRSLEVSEALRRARIEGRDANMLLKQFGVGN